MLFRLDGRSTRLGSIHDGLDHVFCATDLHAGEHVYFSGRFVYSYRFGLGVPSDLKLSAVVQSSAAFPGAFPATWLPTKRHRFEGGAQKEAKATRRMALVDGGVYDNMADQWAQGMGSRRKRPGSAPHDFREADELIVVNASAGLDWGRLRGLRLPGLGELLTLLRDKSVLYDNGNSLRRQALFRQFVQAQGDGCGLRGALVHIPQSPFRIPSSFAKGEGPSAERAHAALEKLVGDADPETVEAWWADTARANSAVPTTLAKLDPETASLLLRHAYVLAMVNLHVILAYPLRDARSGTVRRAGARRGTARPGARSRHRGRRGLGGVSRPSRHASWRGAGARVPRSPPRRAARPRLRARGPDRARGGRRHPSPL
jgi:hypothetical protein